MKRLEGKVAVVTGASKGIGAAIAKHLAAEGAAVVVNYASSKEGADRVVAEIINNGGSAIAVQANVARKWDIDRLFGETQVEGIHSNVPRPQFLGKCIRAVSWERIFTSRFSRRHL